MPRVIGRHTLDTISQVMTVAVKHRKGQKQLGTTALHLKSTLARQPIHNRAYPEKLSTASPDTPISVRKPSSLLLFVQTEKKSLERRQS